MKSSEYHDIPDSCADCRKQNRASFCDLPEAVFAELATLKTCRSYPRGSALFVEGQQTGGVFLLCSGRVKLSTYSEEGKAIILRIAEPGEVLGLSAVMSATPYEKTAHACEDCTVSFVRKGDFLDFVQKHPDAALNALRQMNNNYRKAHIQICSLGLSLSVGDKLARLLLQWCDPRSANGGPVRMLRTYTHVEMAEMIGTTRETVTRLLKDFRDRGLITLSKTEICIVNQARLKAAIGGRHRNGNGHARYCDTRHMRSG